MLNHAVTAWNISPEGEPSSSHASVQHGPAPSAKGTGESFLQHYQCIGELLSICEASHFKVGIPWIPPTTTTRILRQKYEGPLDQFVRLGLVTVPTKALESYCEDLESKETTITNSLQLRSLTAFERFGFALALSLSFLCIGSALILAVDASGVSSWLLLLILCAIDGAAAAFSSTETQRRISLQQLLYREVLRRSGMDPDNSNGLNILSLET